MDYVFNQLTDITLRRLYKFILKRTIGKYLEDDLLIDQLQVISREGKVKLKNIKFNVAVINEEFFADAPVKLVSVKIEELEVHVAYKTLLTESCRFVVSQAEVVFEPNSGKSETKTTNSTKGVESSDQNESDDGPLSDNDAVSEDSQKGLSFIAHWIEIVVARLQVTFVDTCILMKCGSAIQKQHGKDSSSTFIKVMIKNIMYFNTDPQSFTRADESSMALSSRMAGSVGDSRLLVKLGSKKVRDVPSHLVFLAITFFSSGYETGRAGD
jgi:hypothetical protein